MEVKINFWKGNKCKAAPEPHAPGLNFVAKNIKIA
jgi:hypothetical protein